LVFGRARPPLCTSWVVYNCMAEHIMEEVS
jgi:hypothetical protein